MQIEFTLPIASVVLHFPRLRRSMIVFVFSKAKIRQKYRMVIRVEEEVNPSHTSFTTLIYYKITREIESLATLIRIRRLSMVEIFAFKASDRFRQHVWRTSAKRKTVENRRCPWRTTVQWFEKLISTFFRSVTQCFAATRQKCSIIEWNITDRNVYGCCCSWFDQEIGRMEDFVLRVRFPSLITIESVFVSH